MSTVRWSDVRHKHVSAAGVEDVEGGKERLLAQVRAHQLADMRKRRGLTQRQVAQAMGVTVGRVSQIENGELAGIDVLDRYVSALGGSLHLVASFGDEEIKVG
ncbi:MAG TPA: helix-turn-helix transcriptional regulator [Pseudonocardia sp.]|jgi:DNA-binding XRE family transcriptional regulator